MPPRAARTALAGLSAALALALALRLPAAWESGNALNHVSGVWMSLADDLARGTLYRPIHDPALGYGGTRYFPLAFAAQAALVRAGVPAIAAAYAASLAAGVLLAAGVTLLLRAAGARLPLAACFAPLALAGFAGQHALTAGRGDLLPVALSALGLASVARAPARAAIPLAAAALTLAFAAKPTALTAACAGVAWLALRRRRREASILAALLAVGAAAVILATDALSQGRFVEGLRATAAAGLDARTAVRAPIRLAEELAIGDPAGLVLAAAAVAALAARRGARAILPPRPAPPERGEASETARARRGDPLLLPALWLGAAACGALAVLATPGTGVNHLVELGAASAVVLGAAAAAPGRGRAAARAAASAAAVAGLALALALWRADLSSSRLAELRAVVRALPAGAVVSEDPLVPLLGGERPILLDPFTIRLTASHEPDLTAPLARALRQGEFAAVVLFEDLEAPAAEAWYAGGNLGLPLAAEIRRGYRRSAAIGRYQVYLPRARSAGVVRTEAAR
jgi:hypothetical protein